MTPTQDLDVVIVGAGPAGSAAAKAAAEAGATVALLDRAQFPRYKTCGGGLIGPSLSALPSGEVPCRATIRRATFTLNGMRRATRAAAEPFMRMSLRDELDNWLKDQATGAGAQFWGGVRARSLVQHEDRVRLDTDRGTFQSKYLVIADGTSSSLARDMGTTMAQTDLGLEVELDARGQGGRWEDRIHLDWGPLPGSYGWVFPKGETLTVGVIASKGRPTETRQYLKDFLTREGLAGLSVVRESGHLTQCRTNHSSLGNRRVLIAGDAAGLMEPWTREGISFAVRSGQIAGRLCAAALDSNEVGMLLQQYENALEGSVLQEMRAGFACMAAFQARPGFFHWAIGSTPAGWETFTRICRGDTNLGRAWRHPAVRAGISALRRLS